MARPANAWVAAVVTAALVAIAIPGRAGDVLTPGVAAGGVPLQATVTDVRTILGAPSGELQDPTNPRIIIQRWEAQCLGARYSPAGDLVALDVWADLGEQCAVAAYAADGVGGRRITFTSTRADVKAAFGYAPDRVLRALTFTIFVYDDQGIAFYLRDDGLRRGLVDAMTVFRRGASRSVWAPDAWRGR
ncbi:MAG TPA: hypothetical protein VKW09_13010 [bacterium]|nr:hypothetical protein [bacterium]